MPKKWISQEELETAIVRLAENALKSPDPVFCSMNDLLNRLRLMGIEAEAKEFSPAIQKLIEQGKLKLVIADDHLAIRSLHELPAEEA